MFCKNCRSSLSNGTTVCSFCGADLRNYSPDNPFASQARIRKKKKSHKITAAVCVAVVAVMAVGMGGFLKFVHDKKKSDSPARSGDNVGEIYFRMTETEHIAALDGCEYVWYADNEVLLIAEEGAKLSDIEKIADEYDAQIVGYIEQTGDYQLVFDNIAGQDELEDIIDDISGEKCIENACLNYITEYGDTTVDTPLNMNYGSKWSGLNFDGKTMFDKKGNKTKNWHINSGYVSDAWWLLDEYSDQVRPVKVGLIDVGFEHHEDLNFAEIFYDGNVETHGTHVAGIMAAVADNESGICGVYPYGKGRLYGVSTIGMDKYRENYVGDTSFLSLIALKCAFAELILRNVKVINISLGNNNLTLQFDKPDDLASLDQLAGLLGDFFNKMLDAGYDFVVVKSAGNCSSDCRTTLRTDESGKVFTEKKSNKKLNVYYDPDGVESILRESNGDYYYKYEEEWYRLDDSSHILSIKDTRGCHDASLGAIISAIPNNAEYRDVYNRIIVVGAYDVDKTQYKIADFSNGGERTDVYAPGVDIYSTVPDETNDKGQTIKYKSLPGTSMAAPYVAGVAAMVWSIDNDFTGAQVKQLVCCEENTILLEPNVQCGDSFFTARRINALSSVAMAVNQDSSQHTTDPKNAAILSFIIDDETEEALPGVTIVAEDINTGREYNAVTDIYGHFELILPGGEYHLSVDHQGYDHYDWPNGNGDPHTIQVKNGQINYLADDQGLSEDEVGWIRLVPESISITRLAQMSTAEIAELMGGTYYVSYPSSESDSYYAFSNYDVFNNLEFICDVEDYRFKFDPHSIDDPSKWDESFIRGLINSGSAKLLGIKDFNCGIGEYKITKDLKTSFRYNDIADVIGDFSCNYDFEPLPLYGSISLPTKVIEADNCTITLQLGDVDRESNKNSISAKEMRRSNYEITRLTVEAKKPKTDKSNLVSVSKDSSEKAGLVRKTDLMAGPSAKWNKIESLSKDQEITVLHTRVMYGKEFWYYIQAESGKTGWIKQVDIQWHFAGEKPVIYLYPEEETTVDVRLSLTNGELTCTYPEYRSGWSVTAEPDGTVYDNYDGKEYSYLYWEGIVAAQWDFSEGFVVRREDTAEFLREKLAYLGLTPREYNEFIVYWLPKMQENEYNLISFQTDEYTDSAILEITPEPDSIQRVFMAYKACTADTEVPEQQLEPFTRQGFTVIEWGGTDADSNKSYR